MSNRHIILILWSVLGFDNPMKDMGLVCMRLEDDKCCSSEPLLSEWLVILNIFSSVDSEHMPCALPCDGIICRENIC